MGIANAWRLLRAGNQLRKAETWRDRDASAQALTPVLLMIGAWAYSHGWLPAEVTAEDALYAAVWIAGGVQWASAWINRASSSSSGWGQREWRAREDERATWGRGLDESLPPYRDGLGDRMGGYVSVRNDRRMRDGPVPGDAGAGDRQGRFAGDDPSIDSFNR